MTMDTFIPGMERELLCNNDSLNSFEELLRLESEILAKRLIFHLTANQMTPLFSMLPKQATMFVFHFQSQDCVWKILFIWPLVLNGHLEDRGEQLAKVKWKKKKINIYLQ